jgi:SAM-dependent methyltransferase
MAKDNGMDLEQLKASVLARYSSKEDVEIYNRRSRQGLRKWEKSIVDHFMVPTKVLSIGCGGGRESFGLEKLEYEAYGIDISKEQIESANGKKRELNSTAEFLLFDGRKLPFADVFFGSITLWSQVLGNVPGSHQRLNLLRECYRVLEIDGIISISVHDREKTMRLLQDGGDESVEPESGECGDLLLVTQGGVICASMLDSGSF